MLAYSHEIRDGYSGAKRKDTVFYSFEQSGPVECRDISSSVWIIAVWYT